LVTAAVEQVIHEDSRAARAMSRAKLQQETCDARRGSLSSMCAPETGRLSLNAVTAGASEAFQPDALHEAGAVDGGRVLLANYMSMPMHCSASNELFSVCCVSACESIARSIESKALAPKVSVDRLLQIVSEVSDSRLPRELEEQLYRIAEDGDVQLHSAEFSEWVHYAFPGSCPLKNALPFAEDTSVEKAYTAAELRAAYISRSASVAAPVVEEPAAVETATPAPAASVDVRSIGRLAVFGMLAFAMLQNVAAQWSKAGGAMRGEIGGKDAKKAPKIENLNANEIFC